MMEPRRCTPPQNTTIFRLGTIAKDLAEAKDDYGNTALRVAARAGCLPAGTTAKGLASVTDCYGMTALHVAAKTNHLPAGTTAKDLAAVKDDKGNTALHVAAEADCLPADTTAQDLIFIKDDDGRRASINLKPEEIPNILKNTKAADHKELRLIGEALREQKPAAVAVWMSTEMQRLNEKHHALAQSIAPVKTNEPTQPETMME